MLTAIALASLTGVGTALGGLLAFRTKDRLHLVLGLSAGLLMGLVAFDLLPEVFQTNDSKFGGIRAVSIAMVFGFVLLHFVEQFFGSHEPTDSDYGHAHKHQANIGGVFGAVAMGGHVFLDGLALGVALHVGSKFAIPVLIALMSHAFSDGLNTVSFLVKTKRWNRYSVLLILFDVGARVSGAAIGTAFKPNTSFVTIYLAVFSGFIIYLATSHILPEAHSRHPSRMTLVATLVGIGIMWAIVANL
ncbi:MAG TPA: ZIP family metal transporter [Candidatus Nanopelagicaceae bacterium]|nr:ZIP family metal transporter [Candidatus Nanopelagicaceae bacterium]